MTVIQNTIKTFPKGTLFTMQDFYSVCPYTLEELKIQNRHREIMQWRQLGMVIYAIVNSHVSNAGKHFERDHATVIHAMKMVQLANNGYHPEFKEKITQVLEARYSDLIKTDDINVNEVTALIKLQRLINKKLERLAETV